jgi:hypothetical protein
MMRTKHVLALTNSLFCWQQSPSAVSGLLHSAPDSQLVNTLRRYGYASTALQPKTSDAVSSQSDQLASVVARNALIVTRDVEWGQVLLGFEQAQQYSVRDQDGTVVALLAEEVGGVGRALSRQLLRNRRGFRATVFSPDGSEILFQMKRPAHLISSTMYIEDASGRSIGEVRVCNPVSGTSQFLEIHPELVTMRGTEPTFEPSGK